VAPTSSLVADGDPVYLVAVAGDDTYAANNNDGRSDFEACVVDATTGHLACGATWVVQTSNDTKKNLGADALLYFSYMYPFNGVSSETVNATPSTRTLHSSAIGRFPLINVNGTATQILDNRQSASTSFERKRGYYQVTRLLSYVYVIGGWVDAYTDSSGTPVPAGPIGTIERHQQ
jgi:hypothetical protein